MDIQNENLQIVNNNLKQIHQYAKGGRKFFDTTYSPEESIKKERSVYLKDRVDKEKLLSTEEQNRLNDNRQLIANQKAIRQDEYKKRTAWQNFTHAFTDATGEGSSDHRKAFWNARELANQDIEAPRLEQIVGLNPTFTRVRDLLGISNVNDREARDKGGLGLALGKSGKVGQLAGTFVSDITQDRTRNLWWLLNAPQAVANVMQESRIAHAAPDLYASDKIYNGKGHELTLEPENYQELMQRGLISITERGEAIPGKGVNRINPSESENIKRNVYALSKRRYQPGHVDALMWPTGIAINAGVGLMNPLGGSNGYGAVFESKDDPTKTNNVIAEVAAKYILGRTGNILPWDEFKKVRPDVSKDQYMRYKAFKYDKKGDFNPLDGDFTIPTGVAKGTTEGIHGPEIQFLGRSMPLTTTLLPVAAAIAGTTLGARHVPKGLEDYRRFKSDVKKVRDARHKEVRNFHKDRIPEEIEIKTRAINDDLEKVGNKEWQNLGESKQNQWNKIARVRNGLVSGIASYGVGLGTGLLLENERRRRNQNNNPDTE